MATSRNGARALQRRTMLGLVVLALGAAGTQAAEAQAALLGPGAAFIGGGISGIATGELDERLGTRGYPTFGQTAAAVNLGAYRILPSGMMLGAEWHGLIMGEEAHGEGEVGLGGGYGTVGVGYMIELSPGARAYPRIGVGVGGFGMWIESADDSVGFDEVLADPIPVTTVREPVLSRDGPVVDLGGGVELLSGRRGSAPLIGLRFGYLLAPFGSGWDYYERSVSGGPDATISGPYLRLVVGLGWRR